MSGFTSNTLSIRIHYSGKDILKCVKLIYVTGFFNIELQSALKKIVKLKDKVDVPLF